MDIHPLYNSAQSTRAQKECSRPLHSIVVVVALVWVGLLMLVRLRGETLLGGAARMLGLFVWGLLSALKCVRRGVLAAPRAVYRICTPWSWAHL